MSIIDTEWWTKAVETFDADLFDTFTGYTGFDTHEEALTILRILQGYEMACPPEGGEMRYFPAADDRWADGYGLDCLSDSDGTITGFQFTRFTRENQGLYFGVFLDWKDLTDDTAAAGVEAAAAYARALENTRDRLDDLITQHRGAATQITGRSTADLDQRDRNLGR